MTETASLEARSLTLTHDRTPVIDGLDLPLAQGRVTAIVGPNGCGKSTLLNGLARVHAPAGGQVLLDGEAIHSQPTREVARRLALLPQENAAPEGLTVAELVHFGRHPHQGWVARPSHADRLAVAEALSAADLEALADRPLDTLSGGQRQRAWIAMAVAQATPLLLLDEPTSALDLGHQLEVLDLIRELAGRGKTVVIVVHDLGIAARYADEVVALEAGRVLASGPPATVITEPLVERLYGVRCRVIPDPETGVPVLVGLARACE